MSVPSNLNFKARLRSILIEDNFVQEKQHPEANLDIVGFGCNVASETSVQETFEKINKHFGRLDAVVASAGLHYIQLLCLRKMSLTLAHRYRRELRSIRVCAVIFLITSMWSINFYSYKLP